MKNDAELIHSEKQHENNLNDTHERVFRSTATILERRITEYFCYLFLSRFANELPGPVRLPFKDDVRRKEKDRLIENLSKLAEITESFASTFNLELPEDSLRSCFRAQAFKIWEDLENSNSKRIRGYGDLDPETAKRLDDFIDQMKIINNEIINLFKEN